MDTRISPNADKMLDTQTRWALEEASQEALVHRGKQAREALDRAKAPQMVVIYGELLKVYREAYRMRFGNGAAVQPRLAPAPVDDIADGNEYGAREVEQERAAFVRDNETGRVTVAGPQVADGTYTVVRNDGSHITVKIETQPQDATFAPGERIASRLVGPDNETNFVGFAFVKGYNLNIWKKKLGQAAFAEAADAVKIVLGSPDRADEFREAYALRSGRCARCGRKLTVPASLHRGLGPICAGIIGGVE